MTTANKLQTHREVPRPLTSTEGVGREVQDRRVQSRLACTSATIFAVLSDTPFREIVEA
jgi:hypothetical protein